MSLKLIKCKNKKVVADNAMTPLTYDELFGLFDLFRQNFDLIYEPLIFLFGYFNKLVKILCTGD